MNIEKTWKMKRQPRWLLYVYLVNILVVFLFINCHQTKSGCLMKNRHFVAPFALRSTHFENTLSVCRRSKLCIFIHWNCIINILIKSIHSHKSYLDDIAGLVSSISMPTISLYFYVCFGMCMGVDCGIDMN